MVVDTGTCAWCLMYRPEGWLKRRGGLSHHSDKNCKCTECVNFEAGADAMLEGLKDGVDKIYNEKDEDLRLALAYFHQSLFKLND